MPLGQRRRDVTAIYPGPTAQVSRILVIGRSPSVILKHGSIKVRRALIIMASAAGTPAPAISPTATHPSPRPEGRGPEQVSRPSARETGSTLLYWRAVRDPVEEGEHAQVCEERDDDTASQGVPRAARGPYVVAGRAGVATIRAGLR